MMTDDKPEDAAVAEAMADKSARPSRAPRALVPLASEVSTAQAIEAWRRQFGTPDEQYRPACAFHGWRGGEVMTEAAYVAAIDAAMNTPLHTPKG